MKDASQVQEPCFQSKKRLEGPATSLTANDFDNLNNVTDEYILLGKNNKFQHNIQYKCRHMKPVNTEMNQNGNNQGTNDYMLLGNNTKFMKNIMYKPRQYSIQEEKHSAFSNSKDDYMLLGNNAKFSENIIYKPKRCRDFNPTDGNGKENEPAEDTGDFGVQDEKLEPAPFVDTSKFREPPKKSKKAVDRTDDLEVKPKKKTENAEVGIHDKNPEPAPVVDSSKFREPLKKSKKAVGRTDDSELKIKKKKSSSSAIHEGTNVEELHLPLENLISERELIDGKTTFKTQPAKGKTSKKPDVSGGKAVKFQSPPAAPRPTESSNIQQGNDQRLLSLLHKAGIRLPPRSISEQSEYQKNFTWKNVAADTTAIENKKSFQSSELQKRQTLRPEIPKITEYQRHYQAWSPLPTKIEKPPKTVSSSSSLKDDQMNNIGGQGEGDESDAIESLASRISSSDDDDANGSKQQDNTRNTKSPESASNSTAKTKCSIHRESRCNNSEYRANFKSPVNYNYLKNAWDSAESLNENTPPPKDDSIKTDWYSEVCDLRRKAAEYRRRANNTHFCSDHMGQLLANETQLWERKKPDKQPSVAEVNLQDMRPAGIVYHKEYLPKPVVSNPEQSSPDIEPEPEPLMTVEDVVDADDDNGDVVSVSSVPDVVASCDPSVLSGTTSVPAAPSLIGGASEVASESPSGRIPSPELLRQHVKRHHLDRTTPSNGGFLLITPPRKKKGFDSPNNSIGPSDSITSSPNSSVSDIEGTRPKHCVKTLTVPSKNNSQHTFGVPSKDFHILRSQENLLSSGKPLSKTSSSVEQTQTISHDTSNITIRSSGNRRVKKSQTKQHPAGLKSNPSKHEMMTSTYKVAPKKTVQTDEPNTNDILSQSLESNSSLASEILERTRKRLDFW